MPKVALFYTKYEGSGYHDDYSSEVLAGAATEWVDLTDEEYKYLRDYKWRLAPDNVIIVQFPATGVKPLINNLRALIETDQKKQAEEKLAEEKRREAAKLKKAAKKHKDEKALFEALKKKFEGE